MARDSLRAQSAPADSKPLGAGQARRTQITPEDVERVRGAMARVLSHCRSLPAQNAVQQRLVQGLSAIETALLASDTVIAALNDARELVREASVEKLTAKRTALAAKYDALRPKIDAIIKDAGAGDINLVAGGKELVEIVADASGRARLILKAQNLTARGLNLRTAPGGFADPAEAQAALANLADARARVRRAADALVASAAVLAERLSDAQG